MAYQGYLIKVGNYTISSKDYIGADGGFKVIREVQDADSYRDNDGVLHRNALSHVPIKVEFQTRNMLTNREFSELMSNIRANFTSQIERKANVTVYVPELDDYVTQPMYMVQPEPDMYGNYGDEIHYKPCRIAFIGY